MSEFSGGTGIDFTDGDISISTDGVQSTHIADGAINSSSMIGDNVVNAGKVKFLSTNVAGTNNPTNGGHTFTINGLASGQDNGIPTASAKSFVFLNGILLSPASATNLSDGDYFFDDDSADKTLKVDDDLLTDNTDSIQVRYFATTN
jgi:hypothetical protein